MKPIHEIGWFSKQGFTNIYFDKEQFRFRLLSRYEMCLDCNQDRHSQVTMVPAEFSDYANRAGGALSHHDNGKVPGWIYD